MKGLKATKGKENVARYQEIYFIFTMKMVKQKADFLVRW